MPYPLGTPREACVTPSAVRCVPALGTRNFAGRVTKREAEYDLARSLFCYEAMHWIGRTLQA